MAAILASCYVQAARRSDRVHQKRQVNYDVSGREDSKSHPEENDGAIPYMLPASSDTVLTKKKINNDLVCEKAGMFADVNNNCQIFHFCVVTGRPGNTGFDLRQYSFFCGAGTIFDQYTLTCQVPEKAIPCEYAPEFYDINRRTEEGKKQVWLHRTEDVSVVNPYYKESSERKHKIPNFVRRWLWMSF